MRYLIVLGLVALGAYSRQLTHVEDPKPTSQIEKDPVRKDNDEKSKHEDRPRGHDHSEWKSKDHKYPGHGKRHMKDYD